MPYELNEMRCQAEIATGNVEDDFQLSNNLSAIAPCGVALRAIETWAAPSVRPYLHGPPWE